MSHTLSGRQNFLPINENISSCYAVVQIYSPISSESYLICTVRICITARKWLIPYLRSWIDREAQLCLLPKVCGQSLKQERCKPWSCSASKGVKHNKALQSRALLSHFANLPHGRSNLLLADSVVASSIIICCIFFSCDELIRMKQLTVSARPDLIYKSNRVIFFLLGWYW